MNLQQQNKATVKRYNEIVLEHGNLDTLMEFIDPEFINHSAPSNLPQGPENIEIQLTTVFQPAFPDLKVEIHDQVAEGDKVVSRKTYTGTHTGTFMGIAPTNKVIKLDLIEIVRLKDGKYIEHWNIADMQGLLQQLKEA